MFVDQRVSLHFPMVFPIYGFFLWVFHGFPIFPWVFYGFPMVFPLNMVIFPLDSRCSGPSSALPGIFRSKDGPAGLHCGWSGAQHHAGAMAKGELSELQKSWVVVWNSFFFPIQLGIIIPIDVHIFQRGWNIPPTRFCIVYISTSIAHTVMYYIILLQESCRDLHRSVEYLYTIYS